MTTEIDELKKDISALVKTLMIFTIILTTLFLLTSCSLFGTKNPHTEGLILPPKTLDVEEDNTDITMLRVASELIITPSTWFENVKG